MCGIIGLVASQMASEANIKSALQLISNRGPDYQNQKIVSESTWFGHARLAIFDLSQAANQPYEFDNLVLAFNGAIYNYKTLRNVLKDVGYKFDTNSDTEVLIKAWHHWGKKTLQMLDGFFAFAIFDIDLGTLYLCNDHLGKKPIFWREWMGGIAFGSRIDALETITKQQPTNKKALAWLFMLKYIPAPQTAVEGIYKLERGNILTFKNSAITLDQWSNVYGIDYSNRNRVQCSAKDLKNAMLEAVEKRLQADTPVCTLLSGGIDSSIITGIASKMTEVNSFTLEVSDKINNVEFNEAKIASRTAAKLNIRHHIVSLDEKDALLSVDNLYSRVFDEPFADPASVLNHLLFERISHDFKVCLTGDGADELFGGYRRHQAFLLSQNNLFNNAISQKLGSLFAQIMPDRRDSWVYEKMRLISKFSSFLDKPITDGRELLCRFDTNLRNYYKFQEIKEEFELWQNGAFFYEDKINSLLSLEMQWTIPNQMMVKLDRTSMDVGVEARSPFLDKNVIEIAFSMSGDSKLRFGSGKSVLRKIFRHDIPQHVFNEKKRGLDLPLQSWLSGPFNEYINCLTDSGFLTEISLSPLVLEKWIEEFKLRKSNQATENLWTLIGICKWLQNRNVC